jgi:hypothetical protein
MHKVIGDTGTIHCEGPPFVVHWDFKHRASHFELTEQAGEQEQEFHLKKQAQHFLNNAVYVNTVMFQLRDRNPKKTQLRPYLCFCCVFLPGRYQWPRFRVDGQVERSEPIPADLCH